ncbi:MAG: gliding motility-associated C-terminal domain-containing protein, partial [Bacteroidales bacterium]
TITDPGDFCSDDAALDLTAATGGGTWTGDGITDAANGTFDPSTAIIGTNNITYEVTVSGCTGTDNITIDVFDTPDATITPAGPFCVDGTPETLSAATEGGTWSGSGITDTDAGIFDPVTAGLGTHLITYSVNNGVCSDSDQVEIEVVDAPDASIDPVNPVCLNDTAFPLSAATPGGTWSGAGITDSNEGIFDPSVAGVGDHTITYEISLGTCGNTGQTTIEVMETADASIEPAGPFCYGDFTVNLETATGGGTWTGEHINQDGIFDVAAAGPGTYTVTYSVEGTCGDSDQQDIIVHPSDFSIDYETTDPHCLGSGDGVVEFSVNGGTPPYNYEWENGSSDTSYIDNLTAGSYNFTITDVHACKESVPMIQIFEGDRDCLRIPDAFTPNGDGVNDTWLIENLIFYEKAEVRIFNRWGQLLYSGGPADEPWDGRYNGKDVPTGSYMYVLHLKSEIDDLVGVVTLVR